MPQQYQYSKEVDYDTQARSRSFTTFPVRIHKNDTQSQKISNQFIKEWKRIIGGDKRFDANVAQSPVGHFVSLAIPECPPERLAFAWKAFDYAVALDDAKDLPEPLKERNTLCTEIKTGVPTRVSQRSDWRSGSKHKRFQTCLFLEGLESCGQGLMSMLDSTKLFLDASAVDSMDCTSLEDYLPLRIVNMGVPQMIQFISHAMNISLDIKERAAVYHIVKPLDVAMALTNDYFSYPKEKALPHNGPGNIVNAVPILMAQYAITENDALALIKQKILEVEEEHRVELEKLEQKGLLPQELERYIMAYRMATSGSHFWHASTPRYVITRTNRNSRSPGKSIASQFWNWMGSAL